MWWFAVYSGTSRSHLNRTFTWLQTCIAAVYITVWFLSEMWLPFTSARLSVARSQSFPSSATQPAICCWSIWGTNINPNSMGNASASSLRCKTVSLREETGRHNLFTVKSLNQSWVFFQPNGFVHVCFHCVPPPPISPSSYSLVRATYLVFECSEMLIKMLEVPRLGLCVRKESWANILLGMHFQSCSVLVQSVFCFCSLLTIQ